jgi:hypothetical protein
MPTFAQWPAAAQPDDTIGHTRKRSRTVRDRWFRRHRDRAKSFHRGKARLQDLDVFGPTLERGHTAAPVEKKAGVVTGASADLENLPAGKIEPAGGEMLKAPAAERD